MAARTKIQVIRKNVGAVNREIYTERGGAYGRALDYWLQAAAELKRLLSPSVVRQGRTKACPSFDSEKAEAKVAAGVRK